MAVFLFSLIGSSRILRYKALCLRKACVLTPPSREKSLSVRLVEMEEHLYTRLAFVFSRRVPTTRSHPATGRSTWAVSSCSYLVFPRREESSDRHVEAIVNHDTRRGLSFFLDASLSLSLVPLPRLACREWLLDDDPCSTSCSSSVGRFFFFIAFKSPSQRELFFCLPLLSFFLSFVFFCCPLHDAEQCR